MFDLIQRDAINPWRYGYKKTYVSSSSSKYINFCLFNEERPFRFWSHTDISKITGILGKGSKIKNPHGGIGVSDHTSLCFLFQCSKPICLALGQPKINLGEINISYLLKLIWPFGYQRSPLISQSWSVLAPFS